MADDKEVAVEKNAEDVVESPEIHFEPIVELAPVDVKTLEENEEELVKLRAKLFRYVNSEPPEWKERGTGDVKLLRNKDCEQIRLVMRRDKTFKICANHYITKNMKLRPSSGSDRAWVWSTLADFADEKTKPELLAIKFANSENAQLFKEKFEEARKIVGGKGAESSSESEGEEEEEELTGKVDKMKLSEKETEKTKDSNSSNSSSSTSLSEKKET
ncbi:ran-specific GTPase-activating protein-like [Argonauta hians]